MKFTKIFGSAALAVTAVAALASCDGSNEKEILFYTSAGDNLQQVLNEAILKFQAENEGWTVKMEVQSGYDGIVTKVNGDIGAGSVPSIAYCYGDHVAGYLPSGKVLDFNAFIDNPEYGLTEEDKKDLETYYNEGTVFGDSSKRYTMPMAKSTDAVYINKTVVQPILEAKNIDVNTWTWEDLWSVAEELLLAYPKSTPVGYDSEANWVISYLEEVGAVKNQKLYTDGSATGDARILFDNDDTTNMFVEVRQKYNDQLLTTKGVSGSYTSSLFTKYKSTTPAADYDGSFISIGSTGGATHQMPAGDAFEVELAPLPAYKSGDKKVTKMISQGPSLVMFDQGDEEKAIKTWQFAKLLMSTDVQTAYALQSGGYSPVRKSALTKVLDELGKSTKSNDKVNKQCLELMDSQKANFYTSDCFDGSANARLYIGNALIALLKNKDVTESNITDKAKSAIKAAAKEARY